MMNRISIVAKFVPVALLCLAGCAGEGLDNVSPEDSPEDPSEDALTATKAENALVLAFDGTGNHYDQGTSVRKLFNGIRTSGSRVTKYSFADRARANGASYANSAWAYQSYAKTEGDRISAIYYNGAPEGLVDSNRQDGGTEHIYRDAIGDGIDSPVCRAVRHAKTKRVYVVGYSRGAVTAHAVAHAILNGACAGDYTGAKLAWVGLIDPVATGMNAPTMIGEQCQGEAAERVVHELGSPALECLKRLSIGTYSVPVIVAMKDRAANNSAHSVYLATSPANGARFIQFSLSGSATNQHIAFGSLAGAFNALKKDAASRGGASF
jgi:Uncharacterized alpha/beta hydrolase domain (DUF2235)